MKFPKIFCTLTILLLSSVGSVVYSQDDAPGSIRVTYLKVTRGTAFEDFEPGNGDNHYVFNYWYENAGDLGDDVGRIEDLSFFTRGCFVWGSPGPVLNIPINRDLLGGSGTKDEYITDRNKTVEFGYEAWENDAAPECSWNVADNGHCLERTLVWRYISFPPGIVNVMEFNECPRFRMEFQFTYTVPKPSAPPDFDGFICDSGSKLLTTETFLNPVHLNDSRYTFENIWEYRVGSSGPWLSIGTNRVHANGHNEINFDVRKLVGNITGITDVEYRVRTRMTLMSGTAHNAAGEHFESVSLIKKLKLSPLPATINSVSTISSCPLLDSIKGTGKVIVNITGGTPSHLYQLVPGDVGPCNPEQNGGKGCGNAFTRSSSNTFTFDAVAKDHYTVIVTNGGGSAGVCQTRRTVDVDQFAPITLQQPNATPASCQGIADGKITLTSTGGSAPIEYHITKVGFTTANETGTFDLLEAGTYICTATDACPQVLPTKSVTVSEPTNIQADIGDHSPSCNSPFDGAIDVTITQGGGRYSYALLNNGQPVDALANTNTATWTADHLDAGDYTVEIKDADHPQCQSYITSLSLVAPPSFQIDSSQLVTTNLSCFERNDGLIQLAGVADSTKFQYILTAQSTGQSLSSTTARFSSLEAGDYSLSMRRNLNGCNDRFDHPSSITLSQPEEVIITIDKNDIRCFGEGNGEITMNVQGNTPSDQYTWEFFLNGGWATMSQTKKTVYSLEAGIYRMKITNANNCATESAEVTIQEPARLVVADAVLKDIVCFGEEGEVETTLQGGILPYSYNYYSETTVIESISTKTSLGPGAYMLIGRDANGCEAFYPGTLTITAPAEALSFTHVLSDYNGFNVSCTGAWDGFAGLSATGGNGSFYNGYTYSLDDAPFQQDAQLKNIPAGSHTLFVRDGRGCTVSKTVLFTEPLSQLVPELLSKDDIKCKDDTNGEFSLRVTGGVEPYTYALNQLVPQETGTFSGLASGNYTITITDKNGCTTTWHDQIDIRVTPIVISLTKTDVSCYNLANGEILAEVTGGAEPLQQEWRKDSQEVSSTNNLSPGTYTLRVSDQQGCIQEESMAIFQPADLLIEVVSIPVCVGSEYGEIRVQAHGGTAPYLYSADGGITYQPESTLKNKAAGPYLVMVEDNNGCPRQASTEVTVRGDRPQPNFIVASKENVLDTLVVSEISIPKPDSLEWTFDPAITVLKEDNWAPEIKVSEPGNYAIAMKGYFGGCEYTANLTISISPYDPDKKSADVQSMSIQEITVTPNPSTGVFDVHIVLPVKQRLSLSIFNVTGIKQYHKTWDKALDVNEKIDISDSPAGVYILRATTETDASEIRIVISPE